MKHKSDVVVRQQLEDIKKSRCRLVTRYEVAEALGVHVNTVDSLRRAGLLPSKRISRRLVGFDIRDVRKLAEPFLRGEAIAEPQRKPDPVTVSTWARLDEQARVRVFYFCSGDAVKAECLSLLVGGSSTRDAERITGISKSTAARLFDEYKNVRNAEKQSLHHSLALSPPAETC